MGTIGINLGIPKYKWTWNSVLNTDLNGAAPHPVTTEQQYGDKIL
jgi:hypothetical protein